MDTGYRADPEAFARQMETFERMRQTERDFRAGKFAWGPAQRPVGKRPELAAPYGTGLKENMVSTAALDAYRAFAPGGSWVDEDGYPPGFYDLTRLARSPDRG